MKYGANLFQMVTAGSVNEVLYEPNFPLTLHVALSKVPLGSFITEARWDLFDCVVQMWAVVNYIRLCKFGWCKLRKLRVAGPVQSRKTNIVL